MRARHLIVVAAELEALMREAQPCPGRLSRIIGQGRQSLLQTDFPQFSLLFPAHMVPGPAAIARRIDLPEMCSSAADGFWLRCDPVAMVPDSTRVWVGETATLELPAAVFQALRALFAEAGMEFFMPAPGRGYLRLTARPDCVFQPPWKIAGAALEHVLPEGPDARRWRRLLNESQMLLHQLDAVRNLPPTQRPASVWFWGGGAEVTAPPVRELHLIGDDPLIGGLADWLQVEHHRCSADPDGGQWLVQWEVDRRVRAAENLALLEAQWLAPAWSALRRGRLGRFTLASMDRAWTVFPWHAWWPAWTNRKTGNVPDCDR